MGTFAAVARDVARDVNRSVRGHSASVDPHPRLSSLLKSANDLNHSVQELVGQVKTRHATVDRDAEWQRVNSYIADVLKDAHVLYAKLARLQGDFVGQELNSLERISESVLTLGEELSQFSKAFYDGKLQMADSDMAYGTPQGGQAPPEEDVPLQIEQEGPQGSPQGGPQQQGPREPAQDQEGQ